MPVLQAISLDIRIAETHTDTMLTCRSGSFCRTLTLLGLVLVLSVLASNSWAQFLSESGEGVTKYTQYPFLGVDNIQRNMLINAFNFQSRIFSMMSGAGTTKVEAFNIIAMLGALIGALLLFFNAKNRKAMIIAPWAIILVLLIFSPYGSKLLFYPVTQESLEPVFSGPRAAIVEKDCLAAPEICGFSPQIAAIHVASTLQMIFSDAFRSAGWEGLMESFKARAELSGSPSLNLNDDVIAKLEKYDKNCISTPLTNNIEAMYPTSKKEEEEEETKTVPAKTVAAPERFGSKWSEIINVMNNANADVGLVPPDAIELWSDADFKSAMSTNGWGPSVKAEYEEGMSQLFQAIGGVGTVSVDASCTDDASCVGQTKVSAQYALKKMQEKGFFKVYAKENAYGEDENGIDTRLLPGFFVYWSGATNADADSGGDDPLTATFSAAGARMCYRANSGDVIIDPDCQRIGTNVAQQLNFVRDSFFTPDSTVMTVPQWKVMAAIRDPNSPISKMPVKPRPYAEKAGASDSTTSVAKADETRQGQNCEVDGIATIKEVVNLTIGERGTANKAARKDMFSKARDLLIADTAIPDRITLKDICNDVTDPDTASEECNTGAGFEANNEITTFGKNLSLFLDEVIRKNTGKTENEKRQALLREYLRLIQESSIAARKGDSSLSKQAKEDGSNPELVGARWLTSLGGGIATFLGSFIVQIGSWLVGPLAAAIIFFMTMLVDMSLMILIIMTPFLLLAGLFVPGNAIGVLTVSIVGVFVLKFVPVTLVILNHLGMMVYSFIGAAADPELASTMQSMIIISMGGLYASVVTMTFFLLFKLGDASAIMSRFTAIDSSAAKAAEAGMTATKALAALAALPVFGAVGGAFGSRFGSAIAARAGVAPELTSLVRGTQKAAEDKISGSGGGSLKDPETGKQLVDTNGKAFSADEEGLIEEKDLEIANAMEPLGKDGGLGLTRAEASELYARPDQYKDLNKSLIAKNGDEYGIGEDGQIVRRTGDFSIGQEQADLDMARMSDDGGFVPPTVEEKREIDIANKAAEEQAVDAKKAAEVRSAKLDSVEKSGLKLSETDAATLVDEGSVTTTDVNGDYVEHKLGENGKIESRQITKDGMIVAKPADTSSSVVTSQTEQSGITTNSQTTAEGGSPAASAGGIAAQVTVAGGRLDGVGTVDSLKAAELKVSESTSSSNTNEKGGTSPAGGIQGGDGGNQPPQQNSQDNKTLGDNVPDGSKQPAITSEQQEPASVVEARRAKSRNLNQQYADAILDVEEKYGEQLASITQKEKTGEKLTKFESHLKDVYNKIKEQDPAGLVLGEQSKAVSNVERLQASLSARLGADQVPGLGKIIMSGIYGGLAGGGGGLAKIPVIGTAIGEALNEFHQAPERARAWNAAGGVGSWWSAQGDAKRMGFYQKEMAPLAAAHQYNQMATVGGFQAQADIARQAASEAVAKSRTQWEAMAADRKGAYMASLSDARKEEIRDSIKESVTIESVKLKNPSIANDNKRVEEVRAREVELKFQESMLANAYKQGPMAMSAVELAGLGRHESAARIQSLRGEAAVAQTASLKLQTLAAGLDSNMTLKSTANLKNFTKTVETDVFLTPDMLAQMYGNVGIKNAAGRNDELMVSNYGIVEKHFLRGKDAWDSTRGMAFNREAAGRFAALDVDTDYLIAGHLKMVQGKEGHMERIGQYQSLVKYRHDGGAMIQDFMTQQMKSMDAGFKTALANASINIDKPAEWTAENRATVEKIAKQQMKELGKTIPLDAVFDVATVSGKAKYEQKVMTAFFDEKSQGQDNLSKMQKAMSDMFAAQFKDVRGFSQKVSMRDSKGFMVDIGSPKLRIAEFIADVANSNDVPAVSKIFSEVMREYQKELVSGVDRAAGTATMNMPVAALDKIKSRLAGELGQVGADVIRNINNVTNNKTKARIRDGKFEYAAIDKDGSSI